uniref:Transforming acidic coiled-coil-containing protein C-terminal domain-containing protein n=1 Tax=Panagrolaimus sp. ES5 TaxID=591445 RepID=A0AC34G825_9BILA
MKETVDSKDITIQKLEAQISQSISEATKVDKKLKHLQKKYSELQNQMEEERKKHNILDGEYKRLATLIDEAKNQIEQYKAEISSYQKAAAEKNIELQKLCDESNALLLKFMNVCKK